MDQRLCKEDKERFLESADRGRYALRKLQELVNDEKNKAIDNMLRAKFEGDWPNEQAKLVAEVAVNKKVEEIIKKVLDKLD